MADGSGIRRELVFLCFSCCCFLLLVSVVLSICQSGDVLAQGQELNDASQLYSATRIFVLGFYGVAHSRYLAIWYEGESRPVWIANRNSPIPNYSGLVSLTIDGNGSLKIVSEGKGEDGYSFSLFDVEEATTTSAILLDNGNFVLRELNPDGSVKRQLWQSFDYPTDTLLPGMKLGVNHKTGSVWSLTSWRGPKSPRTGAFTLAIDRKNTNQLVILFRGEIFWSSGNWQGGFLELSRKPSSIFNDDNFYFKDFSNENETYFTYQRLRLTDVTRKPMLTLDYEGRLWSPSRRAISCPLIKGGDDSSVGFLEIDGCIWRKQYKIPGCRNLSTHLWHSSGFIDVNSRSKYRETSNLTEYECQKMCISDCDCAAFAAANELEGTGCEIWSRGATFRYEKGGRQITYIGSRYLGEYYSRHAREPRQWVAILVVTVIGAAAILLFCYIFYFKWKLPIMQVIRNLRKKASEERTLLSELGVKVKSSNFLMRKSRHRGDGKQRYNLQFYSFESMAAATNNFSANNKLGEGGFGLVYKGRLFDGQEVAIKRLSKNSRQGLEEFKNEAMIIAELQHTNLVKLVGCCIYREEKLLIYEYMSNKSLDFFLFDPDKKILLDWDRRFNIIQGIVQGLLYLHNYSRLRIIHRDLKVSNILLDDEMNAKISDFGMARIFKSTDYEANTRRVVGTYGYMSPEYIMEGVFSTQSDVYSFGVLLLEIVTGQKNYKNYGLDHPLNLVGYAWELWVDDRGQELIDSTLRNSNHTSKILRCIHISLLCVQQIPTDRPTMLDVIFMIYNDTAQLPQPKPPAFFIRRRNSQPTPMDIGGETILESCSLNEDVNFKDAD